MDFNNGLYVFNGVPGLEASKGERIANALQKLQTKINHLEQVRNSERESSPKSGNTGIEDITLSDVRLKLLFLQLQYMRVKLRSTKHAETESTAVESEHRHSESEYCEMPNCSKETQTGTSLLELMPTMPKSVASHTEEAHTSTASQPIVTVHVKEASTSTTSNFDATDSHGQLPSESVPPSSRDLPIHYHLNIDDVPFILGTSAFESHNLIANVQNLIAKMKTHTKALCGSRFPASQNCASSSVEKDCPHAKRIMREITKDFTEYGREQAKVIESYDNRNIRGLFINQAKDTSHQKSGVTSGQDEETQKTLHIKNQKKQAKKPSNTDSTTSGAAAAVRTKENRQLKSTKAIKKNKHAVPTNKIRANLPHVARQRLLRSIKRFRTQLSEDDISWV